MHRLRLLFISLVCLFDAVNASGQDHSAARQWNEALLEAIRNDFARPTVHARNLFHSSVVMYDAWAAYDTLSTPYFLGETLNGIEIPFEEIEVPEDLAEARDAAISYAAYRLLRHRFQFSPGAATSIPTFDNLMLELGYDTAFTSTDYLSGEPAALGNYLAEQMIDWGMQDGANEQADYANSYYLPVNDPLDMTQPGISGLDDPNRWQALELPQFIDQSGNPFTDTPPFLSPEWGNVVPFALADSVKTTYERDGELYQVYHDPGPPPLIDTLGARENDEAYRWGFSLVSIWQSHHDPADGVMWDISPASIGNVQSFPDSFDDYPEFYDLENGGDTGTGHPINPTTGSPYEPQIVPRADYARVLAEFWADGPDSETPPGHWFTILNTVSDHPDFEKRWRGEGPELTNLEWDVKAYFTLGGAVHDAAITAWSVKGWYDYLRPVSAIRFMADQGQNTDIDLPSFNAGGIPLVPGYVELVEEEDPLAGENNEHVGKIKLFSWRGPDYIEDPLTDAAGVGWILADNWWPYQRPTFVTPPFAGYVSGHSTYSRAAAEVMTLMTGDAFFPGGMGEFDAPQNEFLVFEEGPSQDLILQWATYRDASDQCSLSRIWGGIHPPADDIPGRIMGMKVGINAFDHAVEYIESGLPRVNEVIVSIETVNSLMAGEMLNIDVAYNREMDTAVLPQLSFLTAESATVLIESEIEWLSADTARFTFDIVNAGIEVDAVGVIVSGGQDTEGFPTVTYTETDLLLIDQVHPLLSAITPSDDLINESAVSEGIHLDLVFNEPMRTDAPLQFLPGASVEATLNASEGDWLTNIQWRQQLGVTDTDIEIDSFSFNLSDATDLAGNPLIETIADVEWPIDLKAPLVITIAPSVGTISVDNIGDASFELYILFDEAMNTGMPPVLQLTPGAEQVLAESSGEWLNPFNYLVTYDVQEAPLNDFDVNIVVAEATDAAGNGMQNAFFEDAFTIDLDGTNVAEEVLTALNLYPVPLPEGQALAVQTDGLSLEWELYDLRGKLILNGSSNGSNPLLLPTEALSSGSYLMRFSTDTTSRTLRFVVE